MGTSADVESFVYLTDDEVNTVIEMRRLCERLKKRCQGRDGYGDGIMYRSAEVAEHQAFQVLNQVAAYGSQQNAATAITSYWENAEQA